MAKSLRRLILISWIILILCFIVKLFGGNYFEIICNNERLLSLEKYKVVIYLVLNLITNILYLLAVIGKRNFTYKQYLFLIPTLIIFFFIKMYNSTVGTFLDIARTFLIPFMLGLKLKFYYRVIIGFILDFSFQIITLFIRNLSLSYVSDNFVVGIIYMIDNYIMLFLMYLYSNLIEESEFNMGAWFQGLLSEEEAQKKSYSKFKRFWLRFWRFITFYKLRKGK